MRIRLIAVLIACAMSMQCGSRSPVGPTDTPTPAPPPDTTPPLPTAPPSPAGIETFVGAGDIAACDANSEATARLLDSIGGMVFTLGDHAYPQGTAEQFRNCYEPTWGRHRLRTRPTPGNHDYETANGAPYFEYFGLDAGPAGQGYYSFQLGSWLVLSLNSNRSIPAQVTWLKNVLGRSTSRCTIAYWHHPLFSSGPSAKVSGIRDLWEVLYDQGADLVLSAHDHLYERFAPQDPLGRMDPERGIREFVVGTGGAPLHLPEPIAPNSEMLLSGFGVLKLTLMSDAYSWEFVSVSGRGDSGAGRCH